MFETSRGLVVRVRPLTETSLIVHWLTPAAGRVATVAKGALRAKSPFRGKLDIFFEADFSFVRSRRSELHTLREVVLVDTHPPLRRDLGRLQQAAYAARLIEQTTETDTPLEEVFVLMHSLLEALPLAPVRAETVLAFELKLLAVLGLGPDAALTRLKPTAQQALQQLTGASFCLPDTLRLDPVDAQELDHFLHGYIVYHLGRLPSGRGAALKPGN